MGLYGAKSPLSVGGDLCLTVHLSVSFGVCLVDSFVRMPPPHKRMHARVLLFFMRRTATRLGEVRIESSESSLDKIKSINYSTPLPAPRETEDPAGQ